MARVLRNRVVKVVLGLAIGAAVGFGGADGADPYPTVRFLANDLIRGGREEWMSGVPLDG